MTPTPTETITDGKITARMVYEKPPFYERAVAEFGVNWNDGIIFTYGDVIHTKYPLAPDVKIHEMTHVVQQKEIGKDLWWGKYFDDPAFRREQELEAYRNQVKFLRDNYNRKQRRNAELEIYWAMENVYGDAFNGDDVRELLR